MTVRRFEIRLPQHVFEQVSALAAQHDRSLNRELTRAAEVWASQLRNPALREALGHIESAIESAPDESARAEDLVSFLDLATLEGSEIRAAIETLARPEVQETLKQLTELSGPLGASASSFARDWDSDADRIYDALQ